MLKFNAFAIAAVLIGTINAPVTAQVSGNRVEMQTPCRINTAVTACAVVDRLVPVTAAPFKVNINTTAAQSLVGKYQTIAVIYRIKSRGPGGGVSAETNNQAMVADVNSVQPTLIWRTSNDRGHSWSNLKTTKPSDVVVSQKLSDSDLANLLKGCKGCN